MHLLEPVTESGPIPRIKRSEAGNRERFPTVLPSFNARVFCVLTPDSPILCVSTFLGLKFAWWPPWWWGRDRIDLGPFSSED